MKNRMVYIGIGYLLSTLFWAITAFAQQEKGEVEIENKIKQNPKMMELINEIKTFLIKSKRSVERSNLWNS